MWKGSRRDFLQTGTALAAVTGLGLAAVAAEQEPWQVGCFTRPWAKFDYHKAMDAIAEAGFSNIGLMSTTGKSELVLSVNSTVDDAVRVGEEAKSRKLGILSVWGGEFRLNQGNTEQERRTAAAASLRHLIDVVAAAGSKTLLLGGANKPAQSDIYFGAVADCCQYAADKKLGLTIKPHNGTTTSRQLRKVIEKIGHKNLTIWYDAGNVFFYSDGKLDPLDDAPAADGLVTGWCIKDYRHPKQVDVTPGTGQVDFPAVFSRLKKGGFTSGSLVVETLSAVEPSQLVAEAKKARLFVENLLRG